MNFDPFQLRIPNTFMGNGAVENVGELAKQLGGKKALIVTDTGIARAGLVDHVKQPLEKKGIESGTFDGCKPDALISVIKACAQVAARGGYDLLIGVGGGSVMDTTKVIRIAARADDVDNVDIHQYFSGVPGPGLPMILIATTAGSGAEMSRAAVVTEDAPSGEVLKRSIVNDYLLPDAVIVDPLMTTDLPANITADTGLDALAHALEGYTNVRANVVSDMFAEKAIRMVSDNLRGAYFKGNLNPEARYHMSVAASLSILAFNTGGGPTLTHGIGHSLQAKVHCTHGTSCAIVLPHVMAFNMPANLPRFARIAELMGEKVDGLSCGDAAQRAADAVKKLSRDVGMPQGLRDVGVKKETIPEVVDILFNVNARTLGNNPRDCSKEDALKILEAAW
jgi:alcohol dehydrogenase class IV